MADWKRATFKRLGNGEWGVEITWGSDAMAPREGDHVMVKKQSGETRMVMIDKLIVQKRYSVVATIRKP